MTYVGTVDTRVYLSPIFLRQPDHKPFQLRAAIAATPQTHLA